jgi:hypothetical protein
MHPAKSLEWGSIGIVVFWNLAEVVPTNELLVPKSIAKKASLKLVIILPLPSGLKVRTYFWDRPRNENE